VERQRNLSKIDKLRIVTKLLASNKGIKRKTNMIRLFAAGGVDVIKYLGTKNNSSSLPVKKKV